MKKLCVSVCWVVFLMLATVPQASAGPALAAGSQHGLMLTAEGEVWAWGSNNYGQLGDRTTVTRTTPVHIMGGVIAIAATNYSTFALLNDGTVQSWGDNANGQLGVGTLVSPCSAPHSDPCDAAYTVTGLAGVIAIAAGSNHVLALKSDGTVWAWGANSYGQVGDGTTTVRKTPVGVSLALAATAISANGNDSHAVLSDGTVWSWGNNANGEVGDGTLTSPRSSPVQTSNLSSIASTSGADNTSVSISTAGVLKAWGWGYEGELGNATWTMRQSAPVTVTGMSSTLAIRGGTGHFLAIKTDGTVWTWGLNGSGQLGDGTSTMRNVPGQVVGLENIVAVAARVGFSLALSSSGQVWAWGDNTYGQLGDGSFDARLAPVAISDASLAWKVATPRFQPVGGNYTANVNVTIMDATPSALIRYTTTGLEPTEYDAIVPGNGIVTMTQSGTLKAKAWKPEMPASNVASATYNLTVPTPTFSPGGGTYTSAQTVTIATAVSGTTIRYTTDGTTPTASSPQYTSGVLVSTGKTLKAIAFKTGWNTSAIGSATYYLNYGTLNAPTFAPTPGTFNSPMQVALTAMSGATIRYTLDGTAPTANSMIYASPLPVNTTTTIYAKAFHPDWTASAQGGGAYTLKLPTPTVSPAAGTYVYGQNLTVSEAIAGAVIRYTTNGIDPTASDPTIASGGTVPVGSFTLKARAFLNGWTASDVMSAAYVARPAAPTIAPGPGTYTSAQTVTLTSSPGDATIHYTTDGSAPTTASPAYWAPISVPTATTIKALAVKPGWSASDVSTATFAFNYGTLDPPTLTPAPGTIPDGSTVTLGSGTAGATIRYTTDGSVPTAASTLYSVPIVLNATTTIHAKAFHVDWTTSGQAGGTYTAKVATPAFAPGPGPYESNQLITITGATNGSTIHFTTNGVEPTASDPVIANGGTIAVGAFTLKAIAVKTGLAGSDVNSATYSVHDTVPPTITTTHWPPPNGVGWNNTPVTVSFACSDSGSGVTTCPQPIVFDQDGENQTVTVTATDNAGNSTTQSVSVNIDRVPATVTLTAPASPSTTGSTSVAVTASVNDELSGATTATCNGAAAAITSGNLTCTVNLRPGVNVVMVQTSDAAGNSASASAKVTRTTAATALTVVPATRGLSTGDTVTLHALEDSGVTATNVTWTSDHTDVATVDTNGVVTAVGAGQATLTATASGLSAYADVTVASGALAVGTTRWAVNPFPTVSSSHIVGVSGLGATSLASIESVDDGAIVRGLTTDGEPTWTISLPLAANESVGRVMGDVFGGVLVRVTNSIVRLDPTGDASWRFTLPSGIGIDEWAQSPDGTIFFTTGDAVMALDGATGQHKFSMSAPLSARTDGCSGTIQFISETLGFDGLKIDANGRANVVATTRWWNMCYPAQATVDVTLYRIDSSGATTTVPVHHHEYSQQDLSTPHGWNPHPRWTTMPGDDGGILVWWSPSYAENPALARAAYVTDAGVGSDYALGRPPVLSASGQIGYVNVSETLQPWDTETVAIQKINMVTGEVLWSAPSNGGVASVAAAGGVIVGNVLDGTIRTQIKLESDGSTATGAGIPISDPLMLMGDTQLGRSNIDDRLTALASDRDYVDPDSAFPQHSGGPTQNNAPPDYNSNYNSIEIVTSAPPDYVWTTFIRTFSGVNAGNVASAAISPNPAAVLGIGDQVRFTLNGLVGLLQQPFDVHVQHYDTTIHEMSAYTFVNHPLDGWRYWRVFERYPGSGIGRLVIETGAVDRPAPGLHNWLAFRLTKRTQLKIWQEYLEHIRSVLSETPFGGEESADWTYRFTSGAWDVMSKRYLMRHICGHEPTANGFCQ